MTTSSTAHAAGYALGASEAERARLLAQGDIYRTETEALFNRIGVAQGWRAVDVGCGPLGVLDILADRVGPTGRLTGLDREPRMLEMAELSLAERGLDSVRPVRSEAAATDCQMPPSTWSTNGWSWSTSPTLRARWPRWSAW